MIALAVSFIAVEAPFSLRLSPGVGVISCTSAEAKAWQSNFH
jgi:hypothetical protein